MVSQVGVIFMGVISNTMNLGILVMFCVDLPATVFFI